MLIVEGKKINDHLPFQPNNKKVFLPIEWSLDFLLKRHQSEIQV
jgi:hypothetical protein